MNEKTKCLIGGVFALIVTFYFVIFGLDSKYSMLMWLWGAFFGMAFTKFLMMK